MAVQDVLKILETNEISKRLPSSYSIDNTILSSIINALSDELNELFQAIIDTEKIEDIDYMFGKSLDYYGEDYGEYRDGDMDKDYKRRIKAIKISFGSLGDENTIIDGLASYFGINSSDIRIYKNGVRGINVEYPERINDSKFYDITEKIKAGGIRFVVSKDVYWEDFTYEQLATMSYEQLKEYRYEKGREETYYE